MVWVLSIGFIIIVALGFGVLRYCELNVLRKRIPNNNAVVKKRISPPPPPPLPHMQQPIQRLMNFSSSREPWINMRQTLRDLVHLWDPIQDSPHPRNSNRQTISLVLDLDETLIHTFSRPPLRRDLDVKHVQVLSGNQWFVIYVALRPYVRQFLERASMCFELVIFTAGERRYADPIVDALDLNGTISRRFFRTSCTNENGVLLKNLSLVRQDLSRVCILDNSPTGWMLNPENGIACKTWVDDASDDELKYLVPFVEMLSTVNDVRSVLRMRR